MGKQPSSIDRLPDDVLERLQALLRDRRVTQLEVVGRINRILAEAGYEERISKSSLNRYALRMEQVGAKLRQSREVAEMWIARLGSAPGGQVGHLVNEMVRSLAFDLSLKLQEDELTAEAMPETVGMLKNLALTMQRLEAASTMNVKREDEILRHERERIKEELEKMGGGKAGAGPRTLDRETIQRLREQLGL